MTWERGRHRPAISTFTAPRFPAGEVLGLPVAVRRRPGLLVPGEQQMARPIWPTGDPSWLPSVEIVPTEAISTRQWAALSSLSQRSGAPPGPHAPFHGLA